MKLPMTIAGGVASLPQSAEVIDLFGGFRYESVVVSTDELSEFRRLANMKESTSVLARGRDDLTACRLASRDGLRIMAFLATHLQLGEDPVKLVVKMAAAYGIDTRVDPEWFNDENDGDEPEVEE